MKLFYKYNDKSKNKSFNLINLDNPNPNYLIFLMLFYINKYNSKSKYKIFNYINLDNPNYLIFII